MGGVIGPMYTLVAEPSGNEPTAEEKSSKVLVLTSGEVSAFLAFNKPEEATKVGQMKNAVVATWDDPQLFLTFLEKLKELGHKQVIFNPPSAPKPIDVLIGLLHGQTTWVMRPSNKPPMKEEVWVNLEPGESFRVSAPQVSPQGLEILFVADDDYRKYKDSVASGNGAVNLEWSDKATLTTDDPIWAQTVPDGGKFVFMYYRSPTDQPIEVETFRD